MTSSRARIAVSLLLLGASADLVLREPPGVGLALLALAGTALLLVFTRPRPAAILMLALGVAFTAFASLRSAPWLLFLDLVAACGLAVIGASFAQAGDPVTTTLRGYVLRLTRSFRTIPEGARALLPMPRIPVRGRLTVIARTGAIALVVVAVFATLLISADPVFARIATAPFQLDLPLHDLASHAILTLLAALAAATTLRYAARTQAASTFGDVTIGSMLTPSSWSVVLGCVVALFASFVVVQVTTMLGGHDQVLSEIGLTYATYAHQGYAQMIAATVLSLALIAFAWIAGGRGTGRTFRVTAVMLVALDLVMLASAFDRLRLYEQAYGWTVTRLLAHASVLWLAGFLGFVVLALVKQRFTWLATAGGLLAVVLLLALNVMNPDAFIADKNLERSERTGELDTSYLSLLSDDAIPTMVDAVPTLPPRRQAQLVEQLQGACGDGAAPLWFAANLSRARAEVALQPYC